MADFTDAAGTQAPTASDLLEKGEQLKELGNEQFKKGLYKKAIVSYSKAIAHVRGMPGSKRLPDITRMMDVKTPEQPMGAAQEKQSLGLEQVAEQNIATCFIKLEDGRNALIHADKAISLDASSWKAHLRKAEAMMLLRNLDAAQESLDNALAKALEPTHKTAIETAKKRLTALMKRENELQKKAFAGIFGRL